MGKGGSTILRTMLSNLLAWPGEPREPEGKTEIPLAELDEGALVARAQRGDAEAFGLLYEKYYGAILGYLYRRTLNVAAAEDLTGETFLKALRALPKYRHKTALKAWLHQIATNELRMHWRALKRRPQAAPREGEDWAAAIDRVAFDAPEIETLAEREEALARYAELHAALRETPEPYQTALALRYFEEMSYEEVATAMGRRLGTVKSLISRGLEKLRAIFFSRRATR